MASDYLRVAMLGAGAVAAKYVKLYAEYPRSRLVAVYDVSKAAAESAAGVTGARVADSEEALLADDIDAVVINTPNFLHARQTAAALKAGKHVLLQKPMTVTAAEAAELAEVAARSGRRLGIYMNSLDNAVFRDVKAMIAGGTLGRIGAVNAKLANGTASRWKADGKEVWRQSKAAVGGGSFAMLAYHYINLCQWLLGQPIVAVQATGKNLMSPHIEGDDIMSALVAFGDGALGVIEIGMVRQRRAVLDPRIGRIACLYRQPADQHEIGQSLRGRSGQLYDPRQAGVHRRADGAGHGRLEQSLQPAPAIHRRHPQRHADAGVAGAGRAGHARARGCVPRRGVRPGRDGLGRRRWRTSQGRC